MSASVVGFDIGYRTSYVCVARKGGIETVANEYSDRNTPVYVSFDATNRFIGHEAKQKQGTNVTNTVFGVTKLLGKKFSDRQIKYEESYLPFKLTEKDDGRVGIQVSYLGETTNFSPEQIYAMHLSKLKQVAETNLHNKVADVVINVPTGFTDSERRAVLDAAQVAGLNCLRVLNDTTAAGIALGMYSQDLPDVETKSKHVVVVDIGHSTLQAALIAFNKGKMRVVSTVYDPHIGGRNFDMILQSHFSDMFAEKYKINVRSSPKAQVRLLEECEKLKKMMSSISNEIPLNIESFINDVDVTGRISRMEFEKLAENLFINIEKTLLNLLTESQMTASEIDQVEVVGGSIRIPKIKQIIQHVFAREPRTSLNADEAVARGCALQCAILSPAFKVRDFNVMGTCPYPISLSYNTDVTGSPEEVMEVFPKWHACPFSRQLTFCRKEPFVLNAIYSSADTIPNDNKLIGSFKINQVTPDADGQAVKIKVKVRMNVHGIFTCSQAQLVEKVEREVEVEVDAEPAEINGEAVDGKLAPPPEKMEVNSTNKETEAKPSKEVNNDSKTEPDNANTNGDTTEPKSKPDSPPPAPAKIKKKVKKLLTEYKDLPMQAIILQLPPSKIQEYLEKENSMIMHDKQERDRQNSKNAVEEYVYAMREKINGPLEIFVAPTDKEPFTTLLSATEDWLYDEGEDVSKEVYVKKLNEMKSFGDKVIARAHEAEFRPIAIDSFGHLCINIQKALQSFDDNNPDGLYSHLSKEDMDKVKNILMEKQQWYHQNMLKQDVLKPFEDPVVTVKQIDMQRQAMEAVVTPILNKPKPVVSPPEPEKTKTDNNSANTAGSESNQANNASAKADVSGSNKEPTSDKQDDMDLD